MDNIITRTTAYKIFASDKKADMLSHAYLIVCSDGAKLRDYIKIFVKTALCSSDGYCDDCRICKLIDKEEAIDVSFYPKKNQKKSPDKILTADADEIVSACYMKPLECPIRVFALCGAETMTAAAQNKLLKTLEEPPQNTLILMGASNVYPLLSTVRSRVKRIDIPLFSEDEIFNELSNGKNGENYPDKDRLRRAAELCDGMLGEAERLYNDDSATEAEKAAADILLGIRFAGDIVGYSQNITKDNIKPILSSMKKILSWMLKYKLTDKSERAQPLSQAQTQIAARLSALYPEGAAISIIEKINKTERALTYNANTQMNADGVLLTILEEKYRWQKLLV